MKRSVWIRTRAAGIIAALGLALLCEGLSAGVVCDQGGGLCTQTVRLNPGWNAIYLQVAPEADAPAEVFAEVLDDSGPKIESLWTWIARPWQRTVVNTEAKYLMLKHAFEELGCVRVELKTDARNERSRRAILRLGATQEGILRQHLVTSRGHVRDTVYFSILEREWPTVRERLEAMLDR